MAVHLVFSEADANRTETGNALQAPTREHPFGTDTIGRDILARTIYGGQISIIIGLTAMIVEVILGVSIGALAGYFGGKLDSLLMRMTEAMLGYSTNIPVIGDGSLFRSIHPQYQTPGTHFQRKCHGDRVCYCYHQLALPGAHRAGTISLGERK